MYIANYLCENYGKDQQVGFHVHHPAYICAQVTCELIYAGHQATGWIGVYVYSICESRWLCGNNKCTLVSSKLS